MKHILLVFLILSALISRVEAQHVDIDGPAIAPVGTTFAYVIDSVSDSEDRLQKVAEPASATVPAKGSAGFDKSSFNHWEIARWGEITGIVMSNRAGQKEEIWIKGKLKIVRPPEGTGFYVDDDPPQRDRFRVDLGRYGYLHTEWITPENYVRKVKFNGADALYFNDLKKDSSSGTSYQKMATTPSREAWIDMQTRSPICIREGGNTYTYRILPPRKLTLPKEAVDYLERSAKALKPFITPINNHP